MRERGTIMISVKNVMASFLFNVKSNLSFRRLKK